MVLYRYVYVVSLFTSLGNCHRLLVSHVNHSSIPPRTNLLLTTLSHCT